MDLLTLSNSIEDKTVKNENGWGELVSFVPRSTNIPVPVRAMCMDGDYMKMNEKAKVYKDTMSFLSVFLDVAPLRGDKIIRDGITWEVERLQGSKPYDIVCFSNMKHSSGRSTRRER